MTLVVLGATAANLARVTAAAQRHGLAVRSNLGTSPAWVLAATPAQRAEALSRHALPAFRVIEMSALARDGAIDEETLQRGLRRMVEIGAPQPVLAPRAVAITRRLMPWILARLSRMFDEKWMGPDTLRARKVDKAQRLVERDARAARRAERAAKAERAAMAKDA